MEELKEKSAKRDTLLVNNRTYFQNEIEKMKSEKVELQMKIDEMIGEVALYHDPQLLALFEKVKGEHHSIKMPFGRTFPLTINSPKDLIILIIYSYQLKKPQSCL